MTRFGKYTITSLLVTGFSIGLIYLLTDIAGLWYMYSAILVSILLVVTSFAVNYLWTWQRKIEIKSIVTSRFIKYIAVGGGTAVITWGLLYALTEFAHLWYIISLAIVWVVGLIGAYLANNRWTYSK